MNGDAATFAAVFAALYAAHEVADHWIQTHHQAMHKATPGWAGRLACLRHVATLTATQATAIAAVALVLDVTLHPAAVAAGLAVNAASHWWADRRWTLAWLAAAVERIGVNGKATFYRLGAPRPGHDDPPTLGTGAYALDQSWHIGWLFAAALITATP